MFRDTICYTPNAEIINTGKQVNIPWDALHLYAVLSDYISLPFQIQSFSVYYTLTYLSFFLGGGKSNKTILQGNWGLENVNFISYAQGFLAMY